MKYAIIIPDGAADHPLDELDGRTAFEAANTPNLDRVARMGRLGTAETTPPGMPCFAAPEGLCSLAPARPCAMVRKGLGEGATPGGKDPKASTD